MEINDFRTKFRFILSKDSDVVNKLLYNLTQRVMTEVENPTDPSHPELFMNLCWNSLRSFTEFECYKNYTSIYDVTVGPLVNYINEDKRMSFDDDIISSLNNLMKQYNVLSPNLSQIIYKFPMLLKLYQNKVSMMLSTYNLVFKTSPEFF